MTAVNGFTDVLSLGEVVLLVLGIVLFVVLVCALVYQIVHQRSFGALLGFFLLPIVMIGYPTIRSIQYKDGAITLEKMSEQLAEHPTDPALRRALDEKVRDVGSRVANSPQGTVALAKAQFALGRDEEATRSLQSLRAVDADLPAARELRARISSVQRLQSLSEKVHANPEDLESRANLQQTLDSATKVNWANPNALATIAQAQSAVGEHDKARESIQKAVTIAPNANVIRIRDSIARNAVR